MVGVYKITSPSGGIYIGQSWDIKNRWRLHGVYNNTRKLITPLYNSFRKYEFKNHKFDVCISLPEDTTQSVLDEYEIFFISQFKEAGAYMLNLATGGSRGKHSELSKKKLSDKRRLNDWCKGKKQTLEHIEKRRLKHLGKKISPKTDAAFSKWRTKEQAIWMGKLNRGKIRTEENKRKISETLKNREDNKGEFHHNAKLSKNQVIEIRNKYTPFIYTTTMLAKEYLVSKTHIKDIIKRKTWKHI